MEKDDNLPTEISELKLYSEYNSFEKHLNLDSIELEEEKKLRLHLSQFEVEGIVECPKCHVKFAKRNLLMKHYAIHLLNKPYICPKCYLKSKSKTSHVQHLVRHSKEGGFCCSVCLETFEQKKSLEGHLSIHSREERVLLMSEALDLATSNFNRLVHTCLVWNFMLTNGIQMVPSSASSFNVLNIPQAGSGSMTHNAKTVCTNPSFRYNGKLYNNMQDLVEECKNQESELKHAEPSSDQEDAATPPNWSPPRAKNGPKKCSFKKLRTQTTSDSPNSAINGLPFSILHPLQLSENYEEFDEERKIRTYIAERVHDEPLACPKCQLKFMDDLSFEQHYFSHVLKQPLVCPACCERASHQLRFLSHLAKHVNEVLLKCQICQVTFEDKDAFDAHFCGHPEAEKIEAHSSSVQKRLKYFRMLIHYSLARNKRNS